MANEFRTSIGLKKTTKEGLDKNKAPGQCYDGFICQLIELWERVKGERQDYIFNPDKREVTPID